MRKSSSRLPAGALVGAHFFTALGIPQAFAASGDSKLRDIPRIEAPLTGQAPSLRALSAPSVISPVITRTARELYLSRHHVQKEARAILRDDLGGDIGDGVLHRDVKRVLGRLLRAAGEDPRSAQVFIGNSFLPNAFKLLTNAETKELSGHGAQVKTRQIANIFITAGMLRALDNETQLAWVLAHELAHNIKGHLKAFEGSHLVLGHFHEYEADAEGLLLAAKAGYDPRAAISGLDALERAYQRIESEYDLLKRDHNDVAESLRRLKDIHPHNDLRRAKLLDSMDEAVEAYVPLAQAPSTPLWMVRREASARPTHIDRLEKRLRTAVTGPSIIEGLHQLEIFTEREALRRQGRQAALDREEYAVVEAAYRALVTRSETSQDLRRIEVSLQRQPHREDILTHRLASDLVTRQLDMAYGSRAQRPSLDDHLKLSTSLSVQSRRGGSLRLLGSIQGRRELDAAYEALALEAENLGLQTINRHGDLQGSPDPDRTVAQVSSKLWRAARRVLTQELGRPALPEEIIAELRGRLPALWLTRYWWGYKLEIIESAFGPEAFRSKRFRPSELVMMLEGDEPQKLKKMAPKASRQFHQLMSEWSRRHYTPGSMKVVNGKMLVRYERYHLAGVLPPSLDDQLDLWRWFLQSGWLPPPLVRLLRQEGRLYPFLSAALKRSRAEMDDSVAKKISDEKQAASHFFFEARALLDSALHQVKDFKTLRETLAVVWEQIEGVLQSRKINADSLEKDPAFLSDEILATVSETLRDAVDRAATAGERPNIEEVRAISVLIRRIEDAFQAPPGIDLVKAHANNLGAHLGDEKTYMIAYNKALPYSVAKIPFRERRLDKRMKVPGIPEAGRQSLEGRNFAHFLALLADPEAQAQTKLMAAALIDRLGSGSQPAHIKAGATVGRWLLEDAVAAAQDPQSLRRVVADLLKLNSLHPELFFYGQISLDEGGSHLEVSRKGMGTVANAFRGQALHVRRNEPLRSLAQGDHPFRGLNSRWARSLLRRLDQARAWPESVEDRLDLLDFMNANGEFDDTLDLRIIEMIRADRQAFQRWKQKDEKRLAKFGNSYFSSLTTPFLNVVVPAPKATPVRIVRNPSLRARLFDLLPESRMTESPRFSIWRRLKAKVALLRAYLAARRYFSAAFLKNLRREGSLQEKYLEALAEAERIAAARTAKKAKSHQLGLRQDSISRRALEALGALYAAHAATQDPLLGFLLENYPEPTRARDDLLERLVKARRLSPEALSFLEGHKSYRMPNPLRIAEKELLDLAVVQLRKFSPEEKVDILLHLADIQPLTKEREHQFNKRVLSGDRKKLVRDYTAIKNLAQLKGYMSLLHAKDRALLLRSQFHGSQSLHGSPAAVERLYESVVIEGRDLPPFLERALRAYFRVLTEDEKASLLSGLAAAENAGRGLDGPQILRVALKSLGVSGAKVAQVLATHRGLLPPEYAAALETFKDRAQDLEKMRAFDLARARLASLAPPVQTQPPRLDRAQLDAAALDSQAKGVGEAERGRLVAQVEFLLRGQGRRAHLIESLGPELGSGSIKVVYKVTLDDGRVWVVKLRAPGGAHRTQREFEIISRLVADLEASRDLDLPGASQLVEEVKALVRMEMNFVDEGAKETAMRARIAARPWYTRVLFGPAPFVPKPHPLYVGESVMVEEFVRTTRFSDLPRTRLFAASQKKIARMAVREGMLALVLDEWLEPDPHTGNRHARRGGLYRLFPRLVVLDVGQGSPLPLARLKPLMKAALALKSGDAAGASQALAAIVSRPDGKSQAQIEAALRHGLNARPQAGIVERLMDALLEAEKNKVLILPDYAPLQKAFVLYAGYSEFLPKDYLYESLQRAVLARALKQKTVSRGALLKIWLKTIFRGRASASREIESLIAEI